MSKYNSKISLNPDDIAVIEQALELQVTQILRPGSLADSDVGYKHSEDVKRIRELQGKLHNQKIFYAQVNRDGSPLG